MAEANPLLLSVKDVSEKLLSISRRQFFALRSSGRIPLNPVRLGAKLLYRRIEVEAWVLAGCPPVGQWVWQPEQATICSCEGNHR